MLYIIDRFEQDFAFVEASENGKSPSWLKLLRSELPVDSKEGDVLQCTHLGWLIDELATFQRRQAQKKQLDHLLKRK